MGIKKWAVFVCVLCLVAFAIPSASAAEDTLGEGPALTVDKSQDWKTKADLAKSNWEKLNEKQKQEVYALIGERAAAEVRLMEKYAELGIIDQTVLARFREKLGEKLDAIKDSGELPLFAERGALPPKPNKKTA